MDENNPLHPKDHLCNTVNTTGKEKFLIKAIDFDSVNNRVYYDIINPNTGKSTGHYSSIQDYNRIKMEYHEIHDNHSNCVLF